MWIKGHAIKMRTRGGGERGNEAKLTEGAETEGEERGENTDKEESVSK